MGQASSVSSLSSSWTSQIDALSSLSSMLDAAGRVGKIDLRHISAKVNQPGQQINHPTDHFRFGHIATMAAITKGQAERLHLDTHDDPRLYTMLLVLGRKDEDWDHSDGKGALELKTLGVRMPLYPGDVVYFQASVLPHMVKRLQEEDRGKRTVMTLFTCHPTAKFLEKNYREL